MVRGFQENGGELGATGGGFERSRKNENVFLERLQKSQTRCTHATPRTLKPVVSEGYDV